MYWADALNNKAELIATRVQASEAQVDGAFLVHIHERMWQDVMMQQLKTLVDAGKVQRFWLRDNLFITKGGHVFMSR